MFVTNQARRISAIIFWTTLIATFSVAYSQKPNADKDKDKKDPIKYQRRSTWINPARFRNGEIVGDTFRISLDRAHRWDEIDSLSGFTQSLGQPGKPYQNYRYGLPALYFSPNEFIDPINGLPNVYILNPQTQLPLFDTYTPYFLVAFDQSAFNRQFLTVNAAINVNPYWNTAAFYRRRSALGPGPYANSISDDYNIAFSQYFRTFNKRYHAVVSAAFNQLRDQMNGGVLQDAETTFETSFNQLAQPTFITNSRSVYIVRSLSTRHLYRFTPDSAQTNISVLGGLVYHDQNWSYGDPTIRKAKQWTENTPLMPYANFFPDSGRVGEVGHVDYLSGDAGALIGWQKSRFRFRVKPEYTFQYLKQNAMPAFDLQQKHGIGASGLIEQKNARLEASFTQKTNNLFAPETAFRLALSYQTKDSLYRFVDTIVQNRKKTKIENEIRRAVLKGTLELRAETRNPLLVNAFWNGTTARGVAGLQNEILRHARLALTWTAKPTVKAGLAHRTPYISLTPFVSTLTDMIYRDSRARVFQALGGTIAWSGGTVAGRARLSRFYLEAQATYQSAVASSALSRYAQTLPAYFGETRLFYEGRLIRKAPSLLFYFGLEASFFAPFEGLQYDVAARVFYPQSEYKIPAYQRIDAVIAARVKAAYVYIKFINVNDGFSAPGYYTTPFYPMTPRSLSFGLKWTFYD